MQGRILNQFTMFTYSVPLPTNIYNIEDYFSRFLPRIHQNADLADEGSYHTQSDWVKAGGSIQSVGSVNAHAGNFTALIAAESLPDRLELVSYVIEYGFTLDDGKSRVC